MNNGFGKRIAELRKKRNMTQQELAGMVEMSTSSVAMWELGRRDPDSKMISVFATLFGVTTDYLLGTSDVSDASNTSIIIQTEEGLKSWKRARLAKINFLSDEEKKKLEEDLEAYYQFALQRILKERKNKQE